MHSQDLFPDLNLIRDMGKELDSLIQSGVTQLTQLLINTEMGVSSGTNSTLEQNYLEQEDGVFRKSVSKYGNSFSLFLLITSSDFALL